MNGEAPALSVIIAASVPDTALRRQIEALGSSLESAGTEIIVACETPWLDPPKGAKVIVVARSTSRGDKLDQASEEARGDYLVFLEGGDLFREGWQQRAVEIMKDPSVGAAGVPRALASGAAAGELAARLILT